MADFEFLEVSPGMVLRRLVARPPNPQGCVLFLHGFPETACVWKSLTRALTDYECHAFDWPGYGLSTRPAPEHFDYSPRGYAEVLRGYLRTARVDPARLLVYATDIGALPALLLALEEPGCARSLIVGDFAPFNRPEHMYANLQSLKSGSAATRDAMNRTQDEILANAWRRGLAPEEQFDLPADVQQDLAAGWSHGGLSTADAFFHYYQHFTPDQDYFETNLPRLKTPVRVVWGEKDLYINPAMGIEFAEKAGVPLTVLPGVGHYPHLQVPDRTVAEIRAASEC